MDLEDAADKRQPITIAGVEYVAKDQLTPHMYPMLRKNNASDWHDYTLRVSENVDVGLSHTQVLKLYDQARLSGIVPQVVDEQCSRRFRWERITET